MSVENKIKLEESDFVICSEFSGPNEIVAISTNQDPEKVLAYILDCIQSNDNEQKLDEPKELTIKESD